MLRGLGIVGWDALEPALLAAIATEAPLLLVGPHGSAKTLLLERVAAALSLTFRHYNASILSFDDLLGFPVPRDGRVEYLQTPATIWDAEAVLFDEISRCRPEVQNKLFPLIHERVAQGIPLSRLRHRWAAMNPPPSQTEDDGPTYDGAEPLDVALADRFAFVLRAPGFADLADDDQAAVLRAGTIPGEGSGEHLRDAIARHAEAAPVAALALRTVAPAYVRVLVRQLGAAGHLQSTRRAVTLVRNAESLHAAHQVLGLATGVEDVLYDAVRFSLPDAAWGRPAAGHVVLAAHRAAWEAAALAEDAPERALLVETDPLKRAALALTLALPPSVAGGVIADAFAALPRPARLVAAAVVFPLLATRPGLPASTIETVAHEYAAVARAGSDNVTVHKGGQDWKRGLLGRQLAQLDLTTDRGRVLHNVAATLMADDEKFELAVLERAWDKTCRLFSIGARS